MKLIDLLKDLPVVSGLDGIGDTDIPGIENDSRKMKSGMLFIAASGYVPDNHPYAANAYENGCRHFILDDEKKPYFRDFYQDAHLIFVHDIAGCLALISRNFYRDPSSALKLIGITGTSGKTTTSSVVFAVLEKLGKKAGLIGTIEYRIGKTSIPAGNTTPDVLYINSLMRRMADEGVEYLVMEISSHSLQLGRIRCLNFDIGAFTNFSQDHLDFHGTMDAYFSAKLLMFDHLADSKKGNKIILVNRDMERFAQILEYSGKFPELKMEDFSIRDRASDHFISIMEMTPRFSAVRLDGIDLKIPMIGDANVYNFSLAFLIIEKLGVPIPAGVDLLEGIMVKGRLESVPNNRGLSIIIDYSHKPGALENVLGTLRGLAGKGRILTVFGCGGDRDKSKRPMMGEIASRLSDYVVLTSDNPRTEDPLAIIREIESGIGPDRKDNYSIEVNRSEAIRSAISMSEPGDIVLIAGKGHEDYQIIGDKKFPFSDRQTVLSIIEDCHND